MNMKKDPADFYILIVDDSRAARSLNASLVEPLNPFVFEAANGKEALAILNEEEIDLVITDIEMPVMNGIEVCREVRKHPYRSHVPVIVVSVFDSEDDLQRGFEAGADAYILKSQVQELLSATVRRIYAGHRLRTRQQIVLVTENSAISSLAGGALASWGYTVKETADPAFSGGDLRIVDIPMIENAPPEKTLTPFLSTDTVPVIYLVPQIYNDHLNILRQTGVSLIMTKPFKVDDIRRNIEQLLTDGYQKLLAEFQDQIAQEEHTRKLLREKEELIREVHHRVKNNLQIISSLLSLQLNDLSARGTKLSGNPDIHHMVSSYQARVQFMGKMNTMLLDSIEARRVSLEDIVDLTLETEGLSSLRLEKDRLFTEMSRRITFNLECAQGIALGLFEIFTNTLMHTGQPRPQVRADAAVKNYIPEISIADTGRGLPEGVSFPGSGHVGFTLIDALFKQTGCTVSCSHNQGTVFTIQFPQDSFRP
ncbi:MAG: response regulator [Spirochaetales bacterium]|nr:response regulator [Spirochaetales bacterium]